MKYIFILCLLIPLVFAQDTFQNTSQNISVNSTTEFVNLSNLSIMRDIEITKFFPKEVKLGDVQFNIQIKNNLDETLENVFAIVSGKGFSTYDVVPIDSLEPFGKDYIFVNGNVRESGVINLTIKIDKEVFYQGINVIDVNEGIEKTEEELNLERLDNLSRYLEELKKNYTDLEIEIFEKKEEGYDVIDVNLNELKKNIRAIEVDILRKDVNQAEINFKLAQEEYEYQKNKVENARYVPILTRLKENALIFSAIFGSILAFFALSELLKQKSRNIVSGVSQLAHKTKKNKKKRKK